MKDERVAASKILKGPKPKLSRRPQGVHRGRSRGPLRSKIISYAQGYMLMREAAKE